MKKETQNFERTQSWNLFAKTESFSRSWEWANGEKQESRKKKAQSLRGEGTSSFTEAQDSRTRVGEAGQGIVMQ